MLDFKGLMVIPVCYKCETPVKIISVPQDGIETINYQCTQCNHTSASFLLGCIEPTASNNSKPNAESSQRAQLFSQATQNYKLRAKMQGLVDLKNDGLRSNPADESSTP